MLDFYKGLVQNFPIISIEDPLAEDDWEGFALCTKAFGSKVQVVGDDLLVTDAARIKTAGAQKSATAVIIKPNQVGTVSEALAAVAAARTGGLSAIASHRSGETTDTFIADLSVGFGCGAIKAGSLARGERVCKYNRLLAIEAELTTR